MALGPKSYPDANLYVLCAQPEVGPGDGAWSFAPSAPFDTG